MPIKCPRIHFYYDHHQTSSCDHGSQGKCGVLECDDTNANEMGMYHPKILADPQVRDRAYSGILSPEQRRTQSIECTDGR
jgi:hypothetical protein